MSEGLCPTPSSNAVFREIIMNVSVSHSCSSVLHNSCALTCVKTWKKAGDVLLNPATPALLPHSNRDQHLHNGNLNSWHHTQQVKSRNIWNKSKIRFKYLSGERMKRSQQCGYLPYTPFIYGNLADGKSHFTLMGKGYLCYL